MTTAHAFRMRMGRSGKRPAMGSRSSSSRMTTTGDASGTVAIFSGGHRIPAFFAAIIGA